MTILFAECAAETFSQVSEATKKKAAASLELLLYHPKMYPVRRRGPMRGYRYFLAGRHLFYNRLSSTEMHITAIVPAVMRRA